MPRRTHYKIVEGDVQDPKRILVKVGRHNERYGRISLPTSLIGRVVEVVVPEIALPEDVLQGGECPRPFTRHKRSEVHETEEVPKTDEASETDELSEQKQKHEVKQEVIQDVG